MTHAAPALSLLAAKAKRFRSSNRDFRSSVARASSMRIFEDMELPKMQAQARQAAAFMAALAHETRLLLLCHLCEGEASVGALAKRLDLRPANVSQHLALLRKDGLVTTRREGQTIFYALADGKARTLIGCLYDLFCGQEAEADDAAQPSEQKENV
jgi:ArsR family transcriptional regulator